MYAWFSKYSLTSFIIYIYHAFINTNSIQILYVESIIVCLYFFKNLCILISSFRFVSREFHNFDPPIVTHFFFFSHIKLLEISSLSSMHLAILIYKQILNIFGSKFLLALFIKNCFIFQQIKQF